VCFDGSNIGALKAIREPCVLTSVFFCASMKKFANELGVFWGFAIKHRAVEARSCELISMPM